MLDEPSNPLSSGARDEERERDEILKRLLKTPPDPRPKKGEDEKPKPKTSQNPDKKS